MRSCRSSENEGPRHPLPPQSRPRPDRSVYVISSLGISARIGGRKTSFTGGGKEQYVIPDAEFGEGLLWTDVGVVVTTCPSNIGNDAISRYSAAKRAKYDKVVIHFAGGDPHAGRFFPVICDHYGNVYREGLNFFATVAALYVDMHHGFGREPPLSAQEVNNLLTETVAISIARGNALTIAAWLTIKPGGPRRAYDAKPLPTTYDVTRRPPDPAQRTLRTPPPP